MERHRHYLLFITIAVALTMLVVSFGSAAQKQAAAKPEPAARAKEISKASAPAVISPKVQQALDIIEKGTSFKDIGQSVKSLNLNENEKKALANEIKKQPYEGVLKRMSMQDEKKAKFDSDAKMKAEVARMKQQAEQKRQQTLRSLNQQAITKAAALKAGPLKIKKSFSPLAAPAMSMSALQSESSGPRANVTGVSPETVVVGGNVTIEGENFGTTTRKIYLLLGGHGYECPVNSWSDSRIRATIPGSLADLVGETTKSAEICVALRVYSHTIRIAPDPAGLRAAISEFSSRSIQPGQTLVIEGTHFLTESQGSVTFRFNGRDISGRIDEWADNYVVAVLPDDVEGLPEVAGTVKLRNHAGYEVTRSITFQPIIVSHLFWLEAHHAIALIFGQVNRWEDHNFNLINGWTVLRYWLEIKELYLGGG